MTKPTWTDILGRFDMGEGEGVSLYNSTSGNEDTNWTAYLPYRGPGLESLSSGKQPSPVKALKVLAKKLKRLR